MKLVDYKVLQEFGKDILVAYGTSVENAAVITEHLIQNELIGMENQGTMRFYEYANFMDRGELDGSANPDIKELSNGVFLADGKKCIGIIALYDTVKVMLNKLKTSSLVFAGVKNVGHTGRIGAYAELLAKENCYGMVMGGGGHNRYSTVAPFGGKKGVMSTNPIAMAAPGKDEIPVSADFATSATSGGKIRLAIRKNERLPEGYLIDKDGNPSTDPNVFYKGGAMLHSAGAKGYGIGVIAEMMTYALLGDPIEFNWVMMAVRLDTLCEKKDYEKRARYFLDKVNECPPRDGFNKVYYPGQYETVIYEKNKSEGIPLNESVLKSIIEIADKKNIHVPNELR